MPRPTDPSGYPAPPGGGASGQYQFAGYWIENIWDPATGTWTQQRHDGVAPPMREVVKIGPNGATSTAWVPQVPFVDTTVTPSQDDGLTKTASKTRAEVIAGQYATVNGEDHYIETAAEQAARQAGLQRDANGYYKTVGGQKVYQTGIDEATGRRWHLDPTQPADPFTGAPGIKYDDLDSFTTHGTKSDLEKQRQTARDSLASLRKQYANSRGDAWVVRENILTRIRDTEDTIEGISRVLGEDPTPAPTDTVSGTTETKFVDGVKIDMDFAIDDPLTDLAFSPSLVFPTDGDLHVVARATIALSERLWKPGMLAQPDMMRVTWTVPEDYTALDSAPASTDEFISSNPLELMRDFLAPAVANTYLGKGSTDVFEVKAAPYEIVLDDADMPAKWHKEGADGYYGGYIDTGGTPQDQLSKFMVGLGFVETRNNPDETRKSNGAYGEWQIMPRNWISWSKAVFGRVVDKTPENSETLAVWRVALLYQHSAAGSWRRVCIAWKYGPGLVKREPDIGTMPGSAGYWRQKRCLEHAGLPPD